MAEPSFNWKQPAGRALEAALNRALALDPETREALKPLDGRRVALSLEAPPLALELRVQGERLVVGPVADGEEPDLAVRSTLGALLSQLPALIGSGLRRDDAPPVGRMRVSGDADLARRLQRLAERFDPDWQRPFAAVFGDVLGVQIANGVAAALRQAQALGRNAAESAAEYVTEESRDVVPREELAAFHEDVDVLRDDVERSAARIARLQQAFASSSPASDGRALAEGPAP
ncbi:ubiquinone biosynthesis accessory factor UbiJ [Luteimonas aquatica]|uniref:ubiquinone biosynthesis accessory factor UbiJ n=1 Tax=Luteimonas aquatica TaxID=450364 RepID=UPI001F562713|nr:SCP2 sterol-binding domain-containing protein [Luteimonas aquatica]